jgi:SAM-dependent methyltransferase
MQLAKHKRDWEELAALDPYWAILSEPDKRFNLWDADEFFRTGKEQVDALVAIAKQLDRPCEWNCALDFGCGIGRLTRALGDYFPECHGLDISAEMVRKAQTLVPRCFFHVHTEPNLRLFPDSFFDLIYSVIVLQHQPSHAAVFGYIAEFVRVLRRQGLLAFQLPSHIPLRNRLQFGRRLYSALRSIGLHSDFLYHRLHLVPIRMVAIPEKQVVAFIRRCGGQILDVRADTRVGASFQSCTYFVSR